MPKFVKSTNSKTLIARKDEPDLVVNFIPAFVQISDNGGVHCSTNSLQLSLNSILSFICQAVLAMAPVFSSASEVIAHQKFRIGVQVLEELTAYDYQILAQHRGDAYYGQYVAPNELQPWLMRPLIKGLPPGTLVSVGTQRCFMAAASELQFVAAHCFDYSHAVLVFNLIEARLIELAHDRSDLLFLALSAKEDEWQKRFSAYGSDLTSEQIGTLFEFWQLRFRMNPLNELFTAPPERLIFSDMNYLYSDQPFHRLKTMIKNHALYFDWIDVTQPNHLKALSEFMLSHNQRINVIDTSNIIEWTGAPGLLKPLKNLSEVRATSSIVLQTVGVNNILWTYFAFDWTDQNIRQFDRMQEEVNGERRDLISYLSRFFPVTSNKLDSQTNNCKKATNKLMSIVPRWEAYLGSSEKGENQVE